MPDIATQARPTTTRDIAIANLRRAIEGAAPYFNGASVEFTNGRAVARIGGELFHLHNSGYELEADLEAVSRLSERRVN